MTDWLVASNRCKWSSQYRYHLLRCKKSIESCTIISWAETWPWTRTDGQSTQSTQQWLGAGLLLLLLLLLRRFIERRIAQRPHITSHYLAKLKSYTFPGFPAAIAVTKPYIRIYISYWMQFVFCVTTYYSDMLLTQWLPPVFFTLQQDNASVHWKSIIRFYCCCET